MCEFAPRGCRPGKRTREDDRATMSQSKTHAARALVAFGIVVCLFAAGAVRLRVVHAQSPLLPPGSLDVAPHQLIVRLATADSAKLPALLAHLQAVGVRRFETVAGL